MVSTTKTRDELPSELQALRQRVAELERLEAQHTEALVALRESEELHRVTRGSISDAVFVADDTGALTFICPNVEVIFGFSFEEVRTFGNISRLLGDDLFDPRLLERTQEIQNIERQITDKDGSAHTLRVNVKRVSIKKGAVLYTCREITERKQAEKALRERAELHQVLLDSLPPVAMLLRPHTREIVACNRAGEEVGAVPGKACFETWGQRDSPCPWCLAPKLWTTGEAQHIQPEGVGRIWDAHWIPVEDDLYLHYAFDITERKRAEQEKVRLQEQLHQAQKMDAIGQLAGGVAHDFNNLLTVMLAGTERIEAQCADDPEVLASAETIKEATRQASGVTRSLLTFSRQISTEKTGIDLCTTVEKSSRLLARILPAAVDFVVDTARDCPVWISADPTQIQQVVMNLIINARDAMPDGGTLRVSVLVPGGASPDDAAESAGEAAPVAVLKVTDTGAGMSPEVKSRIFEPFYTTKERDRGTGLGLAVVHGIVEAHGGRIEVESEPGMGSTFTVFLPLAEPGADRDNEQPPTATPRGHGETVLVAEDDRFVREVMVTALRLLGYEVIPVNDGPSLLERYRERGRGIRLFVVDVDLPKRNGLDCLETIRAEGVTTAAIVITGHVDAAVEHRIDEYTGLLRKPFQMADLGRRVHEALNVHI